MDTCVLEDVGGRVASALERVHVVVVVVPGAATDACVRRLTTSLPGAVVVRSLRSDRGSPGAVVARHADRLASASTRPDLVVVADVQWADATSVGAITELATTLADAAALDGRRRLVVIRRAGTAGPEVAALELVARRHGLVVTVEPDDAATLVTRGIGAARAEWLVAQTGGAPDLVELLDAADGIDDEIAVRLSVVDAPGRLCAELVAFGADASALGPLVDVIGGLDATESALTALVTEGLLVGPVMPPAVAAAVRRSCTAARRARVVGQFVEHGPPGSHADLAAALADLGDRSPAAGELYAAQAAVLAASDPVRAATFVSLATAAGVAASALAEPAALVSLSTGDPLGALRALQGADGPGVELLRAAAWSALGDLTATGDALARSSVPTLTAWAVIGAGSRLPDDSLGSTPSGAATDAASALVGAIASWLGDRTNSGEHTDLAAELRRASIAYRSDPDAAAWPVSPDAVGALIARRLGEVGTAERIIGAAVGERPGGEPHHPTHRLLAAWLDARRGLLDTAAATIDELTEAPLGPRDRFIRAAARCALAVRDADAGDLDEAARGALDALADVAGNLYDLDLVTEVAAAAGRARVSPGRDLFAAHDSIVSGLGAPPCLRRDLAWARLRAALAGDDIVAVAAAAETAFGVLDAAGASGAPLTPDAVTAAATAVAAVLRDPAVADADGVIATARRLADIGEPFEAARLCGVVATATGDERVARSLLKESRHWRSTRTRLRRTAGVDHAVATLSEQEHRVGRMVIDGFTHKQIGAALFCSPKTVEHHVAHIRTKLGCADRAEMIAALRTYFAA